MNLVVAVDKNFGIGNDSKLLYNIPEDMQHFKNLTLNKIVVMGRSTLDSLPHSKPLKNRINIILSRDKNLEVEGAVILHSVEEVLNYIKKYNTNDVFIIGGESVYRAFLPYVKFAYLTKIDSTKEANKYFENLDNLKDWQVIEKSPTFDNNGTDYCFCTYENKSVKL